MVNIFTISVWLFLVIAAFAQKYGKFHDSVVVGDMILTRRQHKLLYSNDTSIKRTGLLNKAFRWPGGIVPVKISPEINQNYQNIIKEAAAHISAGSCIKFLFDFDSRSHPVHLNILPKDNTCNAHVGYLRFTTTMKLDPFRCSKGNAIHEFLHVLGFYHMHTAAERDNYVNINFSNIEPSLRHNFEKITQDVSMFNTQYDFESIMHYAPNAFAINKNIPTIIHKGGKRDPGMGRRKAMSDGDFKRLNRMYECRGRQ